MGENIKCPPITPRNISPHVFSRLEDIVSSYLPHDRYVALAFDHAEFRSIAPHLFKTEKDASKVKHKYMIVFTVRLLTKMRYQAFACVFWNGTEANCLAQFIHIYIQALTNAGLRVVATVCPAEQYFINVVQYLAEIKNIMLHYSPIIFSSGRVKDIVHVFDPPKLLKNVRDFLLRYDCFFKLNGKELIASWKDIVRWYKVNSRNKSIPEYEDKVFINRENLGRTGFAAKIFSKTVSDGILQLVHSSTCSHGKTSGTAQFCAFFNNLFDSCNAFPSDGPPLRRPVAKGSIHMLIWDIAENALQYMFLLIPSELSAKTLETIEKDLSDKHADANSVTQDAKPSRRSKKTKKLAESNTQPDRKVEDTRCSSKKRLQKNTNGSGPNPNLKTTSDESSSCVSIPIKPCKLPCAHCWILTIKGMKAVVEKLIACRFKTVNTKCFNVDNVHCFFNVVRIMNGIKINSKTHESIYYELIDNELARMCLTPPATYVMDPDI